MNDYIDIKMRIEERENKRGDKYKILNLYFEDKATGELIAFYDVYIKDNLAQLIDYIIKRENK